tara:strand:- start:1022 stop:1204 length:183 start_codon:yes stop_codon:yes gene_type:complete
MYADRKHVRDNTVIVRFNDEELEAINALARYSKKQRAKLLYDMVSSQVEVMLEQHTKKAG